MNDVLRALRVNAVELLRQPGATRELSASIDGESLGVAHDRLAGDVTIDLTMTSLNDGIRVAGEIGAPWATSCRRCLQDISGVARADVDELYQIDVTDPEAYEIEHGQVDLAVMVREVALLELDNERLCRDECAGLCPECGVDLNSTGCDCDTTVVDPRWAALDDLVLDD